MFKTKQKITCDFNISIDNPYYFLKLLISGNETKLVTNRAFKKDPDLKRITPYPLDAVLSIFYDTSVMELEIINIQNPEGYRIQLSEDLRENLCKGIFKDYTVDVFFRDK